MQYEYRFVVINNATFTPAIANAMPSRDNQRDLGIDVMERLARQIRNQGWRVVSVNPIPDGMLVTLEKEVTP